MADGTGRITVTGLTKRFGPVAAVDGISFTAGPGMVTGFLGPNGAGKSTTLRMLLGLVSPDAGSATIGGHRYQDLAEPGRQVGAVLEAAGFHPARSGRDHLLVYCTACGYPPGRAGEVLELTGLTGAARRQAGRYSLGMRQRLALAAALLGDPPVLVLDEPGNGLDPEGVAWLRGLLRGYADAGRTVLFSSHMLAEVEQIADRAVIIAGGRLAGQGTLAELNGHAAAVTVRTPQAARLAAALTGAGASARQAGPDSLRATGMTPAQISQIARAEGIDLHELTATGSLEETFLRLTTAGGAQPEAGCR